MPKRFLLTITGPSGSGKTSVLRMLEKQYGVSRIITCTTRPPRPNEKDGVDYHFISPGEYAACSAIAPTWFAGNHYGIRKYDTLRQFENHDIIAVIVEPTGAAMLKEAFDGKNGVHVRNIYIQIQPQAALAHMAHRDGWAKAKKRQKEDFEGGLYGRAYELAEKYDCVIANDKMSSVRSMAYDIMNYVEAQKFEIALNSSAEFCANQQTQNKTVA